MTDATTTGKHRLLQLPAPNVQSLTWADDDLIDWVGGVQIYRLNGEIVPSRINYAYIFDAAVISPSGMYVVIYTRSGTKGLVLNQGKIVREINRSFYCADAYEYPVTIFRLNDGREVLAHCPKDYCRLEIEDIETGLISGSVSRRTSSTRASRLLHPGAIS